MHQGVVVGPGIDAAKPALEEPELSISEFADIFLQQQYGEHLFFENLAVEEQIGHLHQVRQSCFIL